VTTADASTFTGALTLDLGHDNEDLTFTGGSGDTMLAVGNGNDTITTGDGNDDVSISWQNGTETNGADTIHLGAGDDIVRFYNTFDAHDVADGGAGNDTIAMQTDSANLLNGNANVTNFETLELFGNSHTDPISLNGYNLPTGLNNLILHGDITDAGDATIANFAHGTITVAADQDSNAFTLVGDNFQTDNVVIDNTNDGTIDFFAAHVGPMQALDVSFSADDSGGLYLNNLYFDGDIKTVSFSGAADNSVEINQTNGAGNLTDTLDLSNFSGYFKMDAGAGINGTVHNINVGNLAADGTTLSNINVQSGTVAGDAQSYHFGSELDHGVMIGGFDGVNGNTGNGTGAANHNADFLDLSALGVHALSDLTITYGTDVDGDGTNDATIASATGAFDGHIVLLGIADGDLTAANFHFG
jgi:hypothetical protein